MKRICAYCQAELNIQPEPHMSHGICFRHFKEQVSQLMTGQALEDYLTKKKDQDFCPDLSVLHGIR
jgi:hypothetical protein